MKSKKGIELSINVIIIAIIALAVLLVTLFIFRSTISNFIGSQGCINGGGTCKEKCDINFNEGPVIGSGCGEKEICCKKIELGK
ncbi:MAG: hypothetical protein NTV63_02705 [Candidatus Woesearchaeota archaeon]|nr:hypothetical protein [Candidatus Woesearchaeota archaeon]